MLIHTPVTLCKFNSCKTRTWLFKNRKQLKLQSSCLHLSSAKTTLNKAIRKYSIFLCWFGITRITLQYFRNKCTPSQRTIFLPDLRKNAVSCSELSHIHFTVLWTDLKFCIWIWEWWHGATEMLSLYHLFLNAYWKPSTFLCRFGTSLIPLFQKQMYSGHLKDQTLEILKFHPLNCNPPPPPIYPSWPPHCPLLQTLLFKILVRML